MVESMDKIYNHIFMIVCIILIGSFVIFITKLIGYIKVKKKFVQNELECKKLANETKNKTAAYSNSILEFIQSIIAQCAMIKFKIFIDCNDITKINREIIKHLVQDVAIMANSSINWDNIIIVDTFLTKQFYERYIIETSGLVIKQMLDAALEKID